MSRRLTMVVAVLAVLATTVATASASTRHGDLTFPQDENAQAASWDYWWGAGRLVTESGNRYVVGLAFTSLEGVMSAGYQLYPLQGPYKGKSVMTMEGPTEWGHGEQPAGRYVQKMTANVPGTDRRLSLDTFDSSDGMKLISRWERIDLKRESYRFTLNQKAARIHPDGQRVPVRMNLRADMRSPLLAGGTGRWFYGVPEDFGFPSRAYQYQQATKRLTGTFSVRHPSGKILRERIDPKRSSLFMVHESNPPEAIPVGLGLSASTQVHPRYAQSYNLQWPWELIYADLGNGAQLMFDLQAYHDTPRGLTKPINNQPTYRVLATLRLPDGTSVRLDDKLNAQHLGRRSLDSIPWAAGNSLSTPWTQTWKFRVSYRGGKVATPSGKKVTVPPFDLGLAPPWGKNDPAPDPNNNRLTQRVPYNVTGSYGGCPVDGFGWSELLVNWYGWEDRDPWYERGGNLPKTPKRCGDPVPRPPSGTAGELNPPAEGLQGPNLNIERCDANGDQPRCEYTAKASGGMAGSGEPFGWAVTITRPGRDEPIVIHGHGGPQLFTCGAIRRGDHVVAEAKPGSAVTVGNPVICL